MFYILSYFLVTIRIFGNQTVTNFFTASPPGGRVPASRKSSLPKKFSRTKGHNKDAATHHCLLWLFPALAEVSATKEGF